MSKANYACCEKCVTKVVYVGENDSPVVYCEVCYQALQAKVQDGKELIGGYQDIIDEQRVKLKLAVEAFEKIIIEVGTSTLTNTIATEALTQIKGKS